jgi:hypothetical protein
MDAEREHETRQAARILSLGFRPPERTDALSSAVYRHMSEHAHPQRRPILRAWDPAVRQFLAGPAGPALQRAVWVGFGDEWIRETYLTVGAALTQMLPPDERPTFWSSAVEQGLGALSHLQHAAPLDPSRLLGVPQTSSSEGS